MEALLQKNRNKAGSVLATYQQVQKRNANKAVGKLCQGENAGSVLLLAGQRRLFFLLYTRQGSEATIYLAVKVRSSHLE